MAGHMLYVGSYAKEDAYRAALVFAAATAMVDYAKSRGFKVEARVALLGDGVSLMKDRIAKTVKPKGRPGSLHDMIQDAVKAGVTIHCWDTCMTARGVEDADLKGKATKMNRLQFAELCYEAKHVVSM